MKKKHKKTFAFFGILLLTIISITYKAFNVDAKLGDNLKEEEPNRVSKTQCSLQTGLRRYNPKVTAKGGDYYTISIQSGIFDVYIYETVVNNSGNLSANRINSLVLGGLGGKNSVDVNFPRKNVPGNYELVFVLKEADDLCGVTPQTEPIRNDDGTWRLNGLAGSEAIGFIYWYQLEIPANVVNAKLLNVNYNGICAALRNGNYDAFAKNFDKAGLSREDFLKYAGEAKNKLAYCNSQYVDVNFSVDETAMLIRNTIASIKISQMGTNGSLTGPPISEGLTIVGQDESTDFSTEDKALQCPAYQNFNGSQIPNKLSTEKQYYKKVVTLKDYDVYTTISGNDAQCKKTCEETVTVTYGPPVASKAGLCFEYKVKVESQLNCQSEFIGDEPKLSDYKVCTPTGACNGGSLPSASGPNNDFDSCVNDCDGGKYSQKCIDSCYKKVYGETTTLPINYTDKAFSDASVKKIATKEEMDRYREILDADASDIGDGKKYSYHDLQMAITEASTGYHYVQKGKIQWKSGERFWEQIGRYYTLNITSYTVGRFIPRDGNCNASWGGALNRACGHSVRDHGFLRNNYGNSVCMAECAWSGCDLARKNTYYNGFKEPGVSTTPASNRQFLNYQDAAAVYKEEFERYENAVKECKAEATCSTKTAEFTIKVNNKTKDKPEVDNWTNYQTSITNGNLAATTINGSAFSGHSIVLDREDCYNSADISGAGYSQTHYLTEWSFPGTWVNNKTGKISYDPKGDSSWHLKKEKFCTNLNSKYVNTAWWTQRILHPTTNVPDSQKAMIDEYNIIATTKDFGYYDWSFKIKCFYALYDNPLPGDSANAIDNNPLSHDTRTVSLTDIFPDNENENATTNPNETGRTPGYNWTDAASNMKNLEYEITPGALYSAIQTRGNEIYDANKADTYLDYEFYLSPSDLNTIRKYSKEEAKDNYNNYPGKIKVANGVAYYESALFRSNSTASHKLNTKSVITLGALGVNNQKRKGSNEAETFENTYTAILKQNREEYLQHLSGGNK